MHNEILTLKGLASYLLSLGDLTYSYDKILPFECPVILIKNNCKKKKSIYSLPMSQFFTDLKILGD